jgi:hypothetical protein
MITAKERVEWAFKQDVPTLPAKLALVGVASYSGNKRGITLRDLADWSEADDATIRHAIDVLMGLGLIESAGTNALGEEKYRVSQTALQKEPQ